MSHRHVTYQNIQIQIILIHNLLTRKILLQLASGFWAYVSQMYKRMNFSLDVKTSFSLTLPLAFTNYLKIKISTRMAVSLVSCVVARWLDSEGCDPTWKPSPHSGVAATCTPGCTTPNALGCTRRHSAVAASRYRRRRRAAAAVLRGTCDAHAEMPHRSSPS